MPTKKEIFQTLIQPLTDQIYALCEEHKIGLLSAFVLDETATGIDICHSCILGGDYPITPQVHMANLLLSGKALGIPGQAVIKPSPNGKPGIAH